MLHNLAKGKNFVYFKRTFHYKVAATIESISGVFRSSHNTVFKPICFMSENIT